MRIAAFTLLALLALAASARADAPDPKETPLDPEVARKQLQAQFPGLDPLYRTDEESPFSIGIGASPVTFLNNRLAVAVSPLQIHYRSRVFDWEILHSDIGFSVSGGDKASRQFTFRTSPRFRVLGAVSIGPLLGYEFISFPDVQAKLVSGSLVGPEEPFSSSGAIYGASACETLPWSDKFSLRFTQSFYKETYSVKRPEAGQAGPQFVDAQLEADDDRKSIAPGTVFQIEISLLF